MYVHKHCTWRKQRVSVLGLAADFFFLKKKIDIMYVLVQNKYKYILCTLSKNMLSHTAKFAAPSFRCRETVYLFRGRQDKEGNIENF